MFTGITEEIGRVLLVEESHLVISANIATPKLEIGGSIAVNGICLTVTGFATNQFSVDVMPETAARTNIAQLHNGSEVNLETPLTLKKPLGGHLVQGHVDGTGKLTSLMEKGEALLLKFETRPEIMHYIVSKGFIAVDGVSLTIVDSGSDFFTISIVHHTRYNTTLGIKRVGEIVNLEVDIIAKYVERFQRYYQPGITNDFLREHGFATD
ncbi:MAG: riboflavin synthase [Dehalococcoidales bacterium]